MTKCRAEVPFIVYFISFMMISVLFAVISLLFTRNNTIIWISGTVANLIPTCFYLLDGFAEIRLVHSKRLRWVCVFSFIAAIFVITVNLLYFGSKILLVKSTKVTQGIIPWLINAVLASAYSYIVNEKIPQKDALIKEGFQACERSTEE